MTAVLNGLIPSVLLTAIVWLIMRLLPRRSLNAATRYLLWVTTLAAAILLPALRFPVLHRIAPPPFMDMRLTGASTHAFKPNRGSEPSQPNPSRVIPSAPQLPVRIPTRNWPDRIMKIWLIVTAIMLLRLIGSIFLLARTKARARPASPPIVAQVEEWLTSCRSNRKKVHLLISTEISTPMVAGFSRPAILIPAKMLEALNESDLSQIGLHETAHLARGDDYTLLFERIIEALFFLHPAVRWITRQLDLEREIACDDFVVEAGGGSNRYAACLTRVAEIALGMRPSPLAVAAIVERSHLVKRVNLLLDKTRHTGTRLLKMRLLTAIIAVTACAIVLAHAPRLFALPESQSDWFVPVIVQDARGHVVTGLGKDAFRLFEDGVEQQITQVSVRQDLFKPVAQQAFVGARFDKVGIVFDTTAEFDANLAQSRAVVEQLLQIMSYDEVFLVICGDRAQMLHDREEIRNRLPSVGPSPRAAVLDGVLIALDEMKRARSESTMLWVISTGGKLPGVEAKYEIARQVQESGVEVAEIRTLLDPAPWAKCLQDFWCLLREQNSAPMREAWIPRAPGIMPASTMRDAVADEEALALLARNQYRLEYTPKNKTSDGAPRKVEVKLAIPEPLSATFTVQYPKVYHAAFTCERCPNLPPNW